MRAHLGVETQRQGSGLAVLRTTPALPGLYSLITLWAAGPLSKGAVPDAAAWYAKSRFTFSGAIAAVRLNICLGNISSRSNIPTGQQKIPPNHLIRTAQAMCHAAGMGKVELSMSDSCASASQAVRTGRRRDLGTLA